MMLYCYFTVSTDSYALITGAVASLQAKAYNLRFLLNIVFVSIIF
ncbi:hypothetical protein CAL7102_04973 [Dulcicalothrix desertica PCC 7102]|nr:hypothetical protein CAL7102_04973 [Dulcicalothrix desertica PCC 7102]